MNILIYYQISTFFISHHLTILEKKNQKRRISHTPVNLLGQMKQQAGLPKVKRRIRRAPVWQMKSNERPAPQMNICNKKKPRFYDKSTIYIIPNFMHFILKKNNKEVFHSHVCYI